LADFEIFLFLSKKVLKIAELHGDFKSVKKVETKCPKKLLTKK
jgi:hypothetical protein